MAIARNLKYYKYEICLSFILFSFIIIFYWLAISLPPTNGDTIIYANYAVIGIKKGALYLLRNFYKIFLPAPLSHPPLLIFALTLLFSIFGIEIIYANTLILFFYLGIIYLLYKIGSFSSKKLGLLSAAIYVVMLLAIAKPERPWWSLNNVMNEPLQTFFFILSIYIFLKWTDKNRLPILMLSALSLSFSIMSHWFSTLFLLPIAFFIRKSGKFLVVFLFVIMTLFLPALWLIYRCWYIGDFPQLLQNMLLTYHYPLQKGGLLHYVRELAVINPPVFILLLVGIVSLKREKVLFYSLSLSLFFLVTLTFFKVQSIRYLYVIFPFLAVLAANGLLFIYKSCLKAIPKFQNTTQNIFILGMTIIYLFSFIYPLQLIYYDFPSKRELNSIVECSKYLRNLDGSVTYLCCDFSIKCFDDYVSFFSQRLIPIVNYTPLADYRSFIYEAENFDLIEEYIDNGKCSKYTWGSTLFTPLDEIDYVVAYPFPFLSKNKDFTLIKTCSNITYVYRKTK